LLVKLEEGDALLGFMAAKKPDDALVVETSGGGEHKISPSKYELSGRGGRGREVIKRGTLTKRVLPTPEVPAPLEGDD
jgi:DNA gyrase subunit A